MFEICSFFSFVHFFALQNNIPTMKYIRIITELAVSDFGSSAFPSSLSPSVNLPYLIVTVADLSDLPIS